MAHELSQMDTNSNPKPEPNQGPSINVGNITNSIAAIGYRASVTINHFIRNTSSTPNYQTKSTRLIRPKITDYVSRPRLVRKIVDALATRSIFIHSDAGYGKTWLIHDFITSVRPPTSVWYTLDREPINTIQFIYEITAAWIEVIGTKDSRTLAYLNDDTKNARGDEALATLIEEISLSGRAFLLILEDLHCVDDLGLNSALESLVNNRPDNFQLILTSRYPLTKGQAKLIAQGKLFILNRTDLAFDLADTQDYLLNQRKLNLAQDKVELIQNRTEGLGAAVGLAADVLQVTSEHTSEKLFERLTGYEGNIYEFFAEEVYGSHSEDSRLLLKRLGIVQSINADVVNLFTERSDGGIVLRELSKHNSLLVENVENIGTYRFHALYMEFLQTRFQEEEGGTALEEAHRRLAYFYTQQHDWYRATQHSFSAKEYNLAAQALEEMSPILLKMGFGFAILKMMDQLPHDWDSRTGSLLEIEGQAAFQAGEPRRAAEAFNRAEMLYQTQGDIAKVDRARFLVAECRLTMGELQPEDYVRMARQIAESSYRRNELFIGTQVELRMIQVGQTISMKHRDLLPELIDKSEHLIARLQQAGKDFDTVKARAFAARAHLLFQVLSGFYGDSLSKINVRQETGYPLSKEERIEYAKIVVGSLQHILDLYLQAETLAKEESEIEWAYIRAQHIMGHAYHMSLFSLIGSKLGVTDNSLGQDSNIPDVNDIVKEFLPHLEECARVFAKYHMATELAGMYCDAADIYDVLGDSDQRAKFASEALKIAVDKGLTRIKERAERIIRNESTFSALRARMDIVPGDQELAASSEEDKVRLVEFFLQAFRGEANVEQMREAIRSDVEDMVEAAKQRLEWCKHVQIIQELKHTQSITTMYRQVPKKHIICELLKHRSPNAGYSFAELWPMFKGVFCLGCPHRTLTKN